MKPVIIIAIAVVLLIPVSVFADDIVTQVFKEGETRYKSCVGGIQERVTIKEKSYAEHGMSIINLNDDFTSEFKQKCLNQFNGLFLQTAVELHRSDDLENAKLLYQHILNSKDDHNQRVYYELGDIAYKQEDYVKAVDYWEKADEAWVGVDYLHSNYTVAVQKAKQQEAREKIEDRDSFFDNLFESDKSEIPRDEIVCGKGTVLIDHICQVEQIEEEEKEIPKEETVKKPQKKSGGWFDWLFNWWK